jgi:type IV secretory pathway VirB10-like protein
MTDVDSENDDSGGVSKAPSAIDGMVPPFLKKHVVTPQLALAVITLAAVATIPLWHLHGPDVGQMASAVHFGSIAADAGTAEKNKEAPDPATPTPFPKRKKRGTPHQISPRSLGNSAAPIAPAHASSVVQQGDAPQHARNDSNAENVTPLAETRNVDVHGAFGDPDEAYSSSAQSRDPSRPAGAETNHDLNPARSISLISDQSVDGIGYVSPASANELSEGAVIHCRWITHVDSEQAGHVSAVVIQPVYSSIDPNVEVIPAGAQLQGWYRTADSGQTRLIAAWDRINFPDGRKFNMGEEPGADELGGTGVGGSVNSHLGKLFGQAILYTALNAVGQSLSRALYDSASVTQTFSDRQPQIKPTIYISPASRFDINVVRDLPLDRYEVRQ